MDLKQEKLRWKKYTLDVKMRQLCHVLNLSSRLMFKIGMKELG